MITIIPVKQSKSEQEQQDFLRSLAAHASSIASYEVVEGVISTQLRHDLADRINFVSSPDVLSEICVSLPDDVLILGNSWDKYIRYMLDNNKEITEQYVKTKMNITDRTGGMILPGFAVKYPVATQ